MSFLSGRRKIASAYLQQVGSCYRYLSWKSNNLMFTCLLLIMSAGNVKLSLVPFDVYLIIFVTISCPCWTAPFSKCSSSRGNRKPKNILLGLMSLLLKGQLGFQRSLPWFEENQRNTLCQPSAGQCHILCCLVPPLSVFSCLHGFYLVTLGDCQHFTQAQMDISFLRLTSHFSYIKSYSFVNAYEMTLTSALTFVLMSISNNTLLVGTGRATQIKHCFCYSGKVGRLAVSLYLNFEEWDIMQTEDEVFSAMEQLCHMFSI